MEASWGVLEAYCAVWRPSWASWSDLGAIRGSFGPSQEPFGAILACEGPLRGRVTVPEADATNPRSAQERPRAPGTPGVRPLKKLQPWLLAVAAAAQQHSCEPWGTPLRASGTVADIRIYTSGTCVPRLIQNMIHDVTQNRGTWKF